MKRQEAIAKPNPRATWVAYITNVLAFIGLWQVLSNSIAWLTHGF